MSSIPIRTNNSALRKDRRRGLDKHRACDGVVERFCNKCEEWLLEELFRRVRIMNHTGIRKLGYQSSCLSCERKYMKRYHSWKRIRNK